MTENHIFMGRDGEIRYIQGGRELSLATYLTADYADYAD